MEIEECLLHFKRILRCNGMRWWRVSAVQFVRIAVFHRGIEHQPNALSTTHSVHMESISFMFTPPNQRTISSQHQNERSSANAMWHTTSRPTSYALLLVLIGWKSMLSFILAFVRRLFVLYFISGAHRKLFSMSSVSDLFSEILNWLRTWNRQWRAYVLTFNRAVCVLWHRKYSTIRS